MTPQSERVASSDSDSDARLYNGPLSRMSMGQYSYVAFLINHCEFLQAAIHPKIKHTAELRQDHVEA